MQSIEEHYDKLENGICPLCGSKDGFQDLEFGKGTEFESSGTYCKSCGGEIV